MIYATPEISPSLCEIPFGDFPSIFLGGSIDDGQAENWQATVIQRIMSLEQSLNQEFIVLNPRRDTWDPSWGPTDPRFQHQVNWELDTMEVSDAIVFYFAPNSRSPVTLLELGLQAGQNHAGFLNKTVVYCPETFWRKGNVDIVCRKMSITQTEDFETLLSEAVTIANRNANRAETFLRGL